jgi:amino acid permease
LDVVGGIGETVLFIILPGYILFKMCRGRYYWGYVLGWIMFLLGLMIAAYALLDKIGIVDLAPVMPGA